MLIFGYDDTLRVPTVSNDDLVFPYDARNGAGPDLDYFLVSGFDLLVEKL